MRQKKSASILRKFLLFNLGVFSVLGLFTIIYLEAIQPSLIKKRTANHNIIINNTVDHLQRLSIDFNEKDIKTFLLSTRFLFQSLDRVQFYDLDGGLIADTNILDLDRDVFTRSDIIIEETIDGKIKEKESLKKLIKNEDDNSIKEAIKNNYQNEPIIISENLQNKLRNKINNQGVKMAGPKTIFFSHDTKIGKNVIIEPYVVFGPKVIIGNNVIIKSFSHLEQCKVENKVEIGPYARIRPNTILKEGSKIGNFVEVKKSVVGKKSKVNHLSYIGDSQIGKSVNIGAGTITCNYDGIKKNKTKIKNNVFIGSNTSLVAPVTVNENSVVGAGSVITRNVKKKSLAITRSEQIEIKNYKRKK